MDDLIAPVHDLAFARDEHILTLLQEYFLRLSRGTREAIELQRNRRRSRRARWNVDVSLRAFRVDYSSSFRLGNLFGLRNENVPIVALVHSLFAASQQIQPQGRIKVFHSRLFSRLSSRTNRHARCHRGRGLRARSRRRRSCKPWDKFVRQRQHRYYAEHRRPCRLLLVFESQLHYDPAFKYVSTFMSSLIGPCAWPPRATSLIMKNISSRSRALMKCASEP